MIPALRWIPTYALSKWRVWLVHDIVASLALAALAAPEALSYASIAGMSGERGLYSAYTAPIAYALFGSSPQLVVGPTTLMSVLTLDAMESTGTWGGKHLKPDSELFQQVASFLSLLVGIQQVVLALVGGASLTALLSAPIISGFTTGSALISASLARAAHVLSSPISPPSLPALLSPSVGASQLYKIFGVAKCVAPDGGSCSIQAAVANVFDNASGMHWATPVLSIASIAFLLLWKHALPRVLPKSLKVVGNMAPLLLLVFTGEGRAAAGARHCSREATRPAPPLRAPAGAASFSMQAQFKAAHIALAKSLPSGVPGPQWPTLPADTAPGDIARLFGNAIQCTVIGYIGALSIGRVVGREFGYAIDESREAGRG